MRTTAISTLAAALLLGAATTHAIAETRVTFKAAKAGTSYYQMAVQIAETVKKETDGGIIVTVEESQGSVQNVMESVARGANYMFTSPPALIGNAIEGTKPFKAPDEAFKKIRALFPIPSLTMHYVVRADSGVETFADLEGKSFVTGKGSFGASEATKNLQDFGLEGKLEIIDIELSGAGAAMKNKQVDGFATAGSWPAPNVVEVAATVPVRVRAVGRHPARAGGRFSGFRWAAQPLPLRVRALLQPQRSAKRSSRRMPARHSSRCRWWWASGGARPVARTVKGSTSPMSLNGGGTFRAESLPC